MIKATIQMTIALPLQPQEEARLLALAKAKGVPPEVIVHEALERVLTEQSGPVSPPTEEQASDPRPIWEILADSMKNVPAEDMALLPRDGASQIDHYVYGLPKRDR